MVESEQHEFVQTLQLEIGYTALFWNIKDGQRFYSKAVPSLKGDITLVPNAAMWISAKLIPQVLSIATKYSSMNLGFIPSCSG
jgi:hypothetical protein